MAELNKTKITSIDELRNKVQSIITLSDYDINDQYFEMDFTVKKISMSSMIATGILPDSLLKSVATLKDPNRNTKKQKEQEYSPEFISQSLNAMKNIAKEVLISPSYEEVSDLLTDNMLSQIVAFVNGGVKALENFRNEQESVRRDSGSDKV